MAGGDLSKRDTYLKMPLLEYHFVLNRKLEENAKATEKQRQAELKARNQQKNQR